MLKNLLSSFPRFFPWIIVWTLLHWLIFLPSRILSTPTFGNMETNFGILSPKETNFLYHFFDHLRLHGEWLGGFGLTLLFAFTVGLLLDIGLLPGLSRSIRQAATHRSARVSIPNILRDFVSYILPALWRFMAWLIITGMLLSASTFTLKSLDFGFSFIFAILAIEWLIMLSWFTHAMIALGAGQKYALFHGLRYLFRSFTGLVFGLIGWVVFAVIAMVLHSWQLDLAFNNIGPKILTQIIFIGSLLMIYFGKFSWIGAHTLSQPNQASEIKPPVRRF